MGEAHDTIDSPENWQLHADEIALWLETMELPVHLVGAGGVGMSGLGILLRSFGIFVTASDQKKSFYLEELSRQGAEVWEGSWPAGLDPNAIVFASSAIPEGDPEVQTARRRGQTVLSRHGLLAYLTRKFFTIAVAGAHGKTTSTAWLAYALEQAGYDPTALVGGKLSQWQSHVRRGSGEYQGMPLLVIEADESDLSFWAIEANVILVTNVELDHPDRFADDTSLFNAYNIFFKARRQAGASIIPGRQCLEQKEHREAILELFAGNELIKQESVSIKMGQLTTAHANYEVGLSGLHNLYNASCLAALFYELHLPDEALRIALRGFQGVARRLELIARFANRKAEIRIIDDYAHHPTELHFALSSLAVDYRPENLFVVWEPHRASRFLHFKEKFKQAFARFISLRQLYVAPLFDAGGEQEHFIQFESNYETFVSETAGRWPQGEEELAEDISQRSQLSAVVFFGAGISTEYAFQFAEMLRKQGSFTELDM